jgi:hypothetical protein
MFKYKTSLYGQTNIHHRISVHIKHNWYCHSLGTHKVLNAMSNIKFLMVEINIPMGSLSLLALFADTYLVLVIRRLSLPFSHTI